MQMRSKAQLTLVLVAMMLLAAVLPVSAQGLRAHNIQTGSSVTIRIFSFG
jgi:hypothetical protein